MIALLLSALLSIPALAAEAAVGNGGDAVVCREPGSGAIRSAELLDFHEARSQRGLEAGAPAGRGWKSIALEWAGRLEKLAPARAARYRRLLGELEDSALFIPSRLVDFPDSDHLAFPKGCRVEQAAVIQKPRFPEDRLLVIDEQIWAALDEPNRAGLMLHAAITKDNEESPQGTSAYVRYLNSLLASGRLPSPRTDRELLLFFRDTLRFADAELPGGLPVTLGEPLEFHANGQAKRFRIAEARLERSARIGTQELMPFRIGPHQLYRSGVDLGLLGGAIEVELHASGRLSRLLPPVSGLYWRSPLVRPNVVGLQKLATFADTAANPLTCAYLSQGLTEAGQEAPPHFQSAPGKWERYRVMYTSRKGADGSPELILIPARFGPEGLGRQLRIITSAASAARFACEGEN